jgi:hypothetical protein
VNPSPVEVVRRLQLPAFMPRSGIASMALSLVLFACSGTSGVGGPDAAGAGGAGTGGDSSGGGGSGGGGSAGAGHGGAGSGGGGHGGAGSGGGGAGGANSFAVVQPILAATCVRCHDPAHPFVPETQTYVMMDLTAKGAYAALVNRPATQPCGGVLVTPGNPAKSYLYAKITQDTPCFGERMPHQGMLRTPPLPADQIATIESWIRGGAKP